MFSRLYKKLVQKWLNLSRKRRAFYTTLFSVVLLIIIIPFSAKATVGASIASFLASIIGIILGWLAPVITLEINMFVKFAQFNNFLDVTAVKEGWKLVRDVCNMFFIIILLIISFATILRIESYAYKKWLGKLVIAAILINFSKTITGLLIGFSQIIMLTFVSAFRSAVAGNLGAGLHLNEMLAASKSGELGKFSDNKDDKLDAFAVFGALLLALALLTVFVVVMIVMIVVLVGRIVTLWVLVILSPVAYLLQASPFGEKYAKQWWQELGKNLIAGPVLAFFLWLAFLTVQRSGGKVVEHMENPIDVSGSSGVGVAASAPVFISGISETSALMDYIITIALLIAALKITQDLGVIGSSFAGKMQQNLGKMGKKAAKAGTWGLAKYTDRKIGSAKGNKFGISAHNIVDKAKGIKESWAKSADKERSKIRRRGADNASHSSGLVRAVLGSGKDWADRYGPVGTLGVKGAKNIIRDTFSKGLNTHAKTSEKAEEEKKKYDEEMARRETIELEIIAKPNAAQENFDKAKADQETHKLELTELTEEMEKAEKDGDLDEETKKEFKKRLKKKKKQIEDDKTKVVAAGTVKEEWDNLPQEEKDKVEADKEYVKSIRRDREDIKGLEYEMGLHKKGSKEYEDLKDQKETAEMSLIDKEHKHGLDIYGSEGEFKNQSSIELNTNLKKQTGIKQKADKKLSKLSMGRSLAARVEERSQIEESKKKYKHLKGHPELIQYLDSALQKGEEFDAIGLMEKLAEDGNENEFLKHYGYESGPIGLHKFVQEKLIKEQGIDEQLALGLQNDIGEIAKETGHWELAETTDISKTGKLRSIITEQKDENGNIEYDLKEHTIRAHVEFSKRDNRRMMQNTNRLGIGSENGETGEFEISDLGRLILLNLSKNHEFITKRINELNPNLLSTITRPKVRKQVEKIIGKNSVLYQKLDDMVGERGAIKDTGAATESLIGYDEIQEAKKKKIGK
jgi:hypothetical protein